MRDLEIRGAGDLLGAEQSGHVAAIGFELYVELLAEAVAELSGTRRAAGAARARRGAGGCLRARGLHPRRGAEDRPAPTARARRVGGRAAGAPRRRGGSLRPRAGAGGAPLRDPGGEAEARPPRRGLPRLPLGQDGDRPARARLGGAPRPARAWSTPPSIRAPRARSLSGATGSRQRSRLVDAILDLRLAA